MKLAKGMLVAITFDDHAKGTDKPLRFVVYGRVAIITRASVTVDCWHEAGSDVRDDNTEKYTVVRKAIVFVGELVVKSVHHPK